MSSSATTSSTELDRKALRRPDDFAQAVRKFFDAVAANAGTTLTVLGILFIVGLASAIYMNHRADRAAHGREALFKANQALETSLKAMLPAAPVVKKGDDKAQAAADAEAAKNLEALQYKKLDVDAQLGPVVKQYEAVIAQYPGSRAAYDARLALGDLYYQHGQAEKSLPWFQGAADAAPNGFEKTLALTALGYSYESAGKPGDAMTAYEKAISQGEAGLKGDLLLALARAQALSGKKDQARNTYDQILSQLPNTEQSKQAETLKARLDAAK
jgi:TolA-binding protein